ncbi:MAG TPA: hypothetical protein VHB79_05835 [Polyangiaceae bacterium]|nr:hypothetical protein [Polyangiaceae bacterium]
MFQVVPEPEFSAWFEDLPEPLAEEVATAIDLAASAGGGLAPERLSRLLLWFDGTGSGGCESSGLDELARRGLEHATALPVERLRSYLVWHEEVLLCLQSAPFLARLERLEAARAEQALAQVEQLKQKLRAVRLAGSHVVLRAAAVNERATLSLRTAFEELLQLAGLEAKLLLGSGSGLRELCIDNVRPQLRVLFGLDFPAKRLIAIVGETLDRRYYGDTVRLAEQRWQAYLARRGAELTKGAP